MTTYKNPFHSPDYQGSKPVIEAKAEPTEYKGYQIFKRTEVHRKFTETHKSVHVDTVYDIVKDGICVGMYAGPIGAMGRIDELTKQF